VSLRAGESANLSLTLTPRGGFAGAVLLSLENAPAGVDLRPPAVNVPGGSPVNVTLTLSTQPSTPPGTYNLSLKATSGARTASQPLRLTVQGGGDISGTVSLGQGIRSLDEPSSLPVFGMAPLREPPPETQAVPGELIVKIVGEPGPQALPQNLRAGGSLLRLLRPLALPGVGLYRVEEGVAPQALGEVRALEALAAQVERLPGVAYAQPNYIRYPLKTPNDEYYRYQWHYDPQHLNLPAAWDIEDGRSRQVVVAVLDTGGLYRKRHPDLTPNQLPGYDFISDPFRAQDGDGRDPDPEDEERASEDVGQLLGSGYHGAHVAGTIAAVTDNGVGVAGVSWGAKVVHVRVLGLGGGEDADILDGLLWAAGVEVPGVPRNANPAQVINMSLGGKDLCSQVPAWQDAINRVNAQPQKPVIVVAAGNEQDDASRYTPASCQGVITVGATEFRNYRAYYSNYGPRIDVMAPGGDVTQDLNGDGYPDGVLSTLWSNSRNQPNFVFYQGTSMAAPHVAGIVALMKARNPNLGYAEVLNILKSTAKPLTDQACTGAPHPRVTVNLRASDCGAGLVDPVRALQAVGGGGPGPSPDFGLQLSPTSATLAPGQSVQVQVAVLASGGFNSPVSLSLVGAPSGVSGSFSPNPATQSSLLTLTVASGAPAGSYTLTVRGTAGSLTREAQLALTVTATPPPPPPPATIAGTYVFGLHIDEDGNLDETKSTYIRILRDGRSAPYTLRNLAPGTYLVAAWKDVNGNDEVDEGDYLGFYADAQGNYLVSPPRSQVDFTMDLFRGTSSLDVGFPVRDWIRRLMHSR
jgi:serine protease